MSQERDPDRPLPGPRDDDTADSAEPAAEPAGAGAEDGSRDGRAEGDFGEDEQHLVDRDKIDFDPDEGLYTGTAVDGNSDIPGPHQEGDDVEGTGPPEDEQELQEQRARRDGDSGDESDDTSD